MTADTELPLPPSSPGTDGDVLATAIARTRRMAARCSSVGPFWTRGAAARDHMGRPCCPLDIEAATFSVDGAFLRSTRPEGELFRAFLRVMQQALATVLHRPVSDPLAALDDPALTDQDCLDLLRRAEELARQAHPRSRGAADR